MRRRNGSAKMSAMHRLWLIGLVSTSVLAADPESPSAWRAEVSLTPFTTQLNGLWVQHHGSGLQVAVAVSSRFRLLAGVTHHWSAGGSGFRTDFQDTLRIDVQQYPTKLLAKTVLLAGTESVLARGAVAGLRAPHRFELVFQGLIGASSSSVELKPVSMRVDGSVSPPTFGEAGLRFTAGAAIGFRFEFLERFSLRADVRSVLFTDRVSRVNGCDASDLRVMDGALRGGQRVTTAGVSAACQVDRFDGAHPDGTRRSNDVPLGLGIVRNPSSEWTALVSAQLSFGVTF
jgi:hypothetical protein